jgi:hypothetical protein
VVYAGAVGKRATSQAPNDVPVFAQNQPPLPVGMSARNERSKFGERVGERGSQQLLFSARIACRAGSETAVAIEGRQLPRPAFEFCTGLRPIHVHFPAPLPNPLPGFRSRPKILHLWRGEGADCRFLSEVFARTLWPSPHDPSLQSLPLTPTFPEPEPDPGL